MEFSLSLEDDKRKECQSVLTTLVAESPAIETALLSSPDGILLAGTGKETDLDVMAAMSASLLSLADALSSSSEDGVCDKVICESSDSALVCLHAGKLILTSIGKGDANIGFVLASSRQVAKKIVDIAGA